jgi:hypothetical protein
MYNKPYIWRIPYAPNKRIGVFNGRERKTHYTIFFGGIMLPAPDVGRLKYSQDPATYDLIYDVECSPQEILEYGRLANTGNCPLVREDVLKILQEVCPGDFQAFPAVVRGINPDIPPFELTNYWLINVTNLAKVLDEEAWAKKPGFHVYKENSMGEHHLSRIDGDRIITIVSPHLYRVLKKSKIKGLMFEKDHADKLKRLGHA